MECRDEQILNNLKVLLLNTIQRGESSLGTRLYRFKFILIYIHWDNSL